VMLANFPATNESHQIFAGAYEVLWCNKGRRSASIRTTREQLSQQEVRTIKIFFLDDQKSAMSGPHSANNGGNSTVCNSIDSLILPSDWQTQGAKTVYAYWYFSTLYSENPFGGTVIIFAASCVHQCTPSVNNAYLSNRDQNAAHGW
jgi:hypothetical protein